MILSLKEIADLTGGRLVEPRRAGGGAGHRRACGDGLPRGRARGSLHRLASARAWTGTSSSAPPATPGRGRADLARGRAAPVVVDDVQRGSPPWARAVLRAHPDLKVIGITGSSGKTSTKDLLASVLASGPRPCRRSASLNSEVGHPLTVCRNGPRPASSSWRWGRAAPVTSSTSPRSPRRRSVWSSTSAPPTSASSASGRPSAGPRPSWSTRPSRTAWRCSTPTTPWWRRWRARPQPDAARRHEPTGPGCERGHRARRGRSPSFTVRRRSRPTGRVSLPLHGEHHVGNALAVIAVALECGLDTNEMAAAPRPRPRPAAGGWRSPSARTASPWSTTRTTPTPTRCGPR